MSDIKISALTSYTPAVDTDVLPIVDTTLTTTKKITWANIKATLKTYFDTLYVSISGALGTPSSGTLTNCSGLPLSGVVSSTSTALGVGSLEVGNASDTTVSRVSAGVIAVEGSTVPTFGSINTYTALNTFTAIGLTNNAITASGNAATVPITHRLSTVTNNSAATLTITITTTSAQDGQLLIVRVLPSSAVAQTIVWVNTENSATSAPVLTNASTTSPITAGFQYNSGTSKWRCIASS